jgi:Serine/threonine protein kinase
MTLAPGTRLGPFQIVDELGEGGMGVVYRARDPRLSRDVAIKIVRWSVTGDHDRRQRFIQEPKRRRALSHPSIVDLGLALSPDGKHLLFTTIDNLGADLMLIEQFR